jgi:hypothetical protein
MRLFRQETSRDWVPVVERVRAELTELARQHNGESATTTSSRDAGSRARTVTKGEPPPSDIFSAVSETRYGIIQYFRQPAAIGQCLQLYGEYLHAHIELLRRLIGTDDASVEFGAGCGFHTIALASMSANVIAYEADPIVRRLLRQNVRANKLRNVTVLPAHSPSVPSSAAALAVDALSLSRLSLIKVNDDSLAEVIRGAEGTLWKLRPSVFAIASESKRTSLREQLAAFGYRCWRLETPLFSPDNFNRRPENVFGNRSVPAMLAIPEELDVQVPPICDEIR